MTWLNPWAWIGVVGVALPVLIHLLGRGHARVHRFPTLRFLAASRLLPTRRTRIHDALLLAVRCGAIILAAAALARPLLLTAPRRQLLDRGLARAIIVDTSASMRRAIPAGTPAIDSARSAARSLASESRASVVVESNEPARAIAPAVNWLTRQGRRGELVVISDFQRGQVDSSDVAGVTKGIGIALSRVPAVRSPTLESAASISGVRVLARTTLAGNRTDVEWLAAGASPLGGLVSLLGGDADSAALLATRNAAATIATPLPVDTAHPIAIVFPKYRGRAEMRSRLASASRLPLPIIFTDSAPGSLESARLVAAASRALSMAPLSGEREPETLSDAELAALQRPASIDAPSQLRGLDENGPSDGRWLWLGVLALLLAEVPLRRSRDATLARVGEERARAA